MVNPSLPIQKWLPKSTNGYVNCFKSLGTNRGTYSIWMRQAFFMCEFYFVFEISSAKILSNSMVPNTSILNAQHSGLKGKKVCLTYAFTVNADGTEKDHPLIIKEAKQPHVF